MTFPQSAHNFVPHRATMLLIDQVLACDESRIVVSVPIAIDSPFHVKGGVPSYLGIEYIAQAAAAYSAINSLSESTPRDGMLLGTRNYSCFVPVFVSGTTLEVHATCLMRAESGLAQFAGSIFHNGNEIATATITTMEAQKG